VLFRSEEVTKEVVMMFSGWNSKVAMEFGKGGHPTEKLDYFSINGKSFPATQPIRVKKGDVVRFRLLAVSSAVSFHLHGHDMLVTHKDGLPLDNPYWADVIDISEGSRIDAIVKMNNPGIWLNHDHIEHHTSNSGKFPGGAVAILEYEGVEPKSYYLWKDKVYQNDFYLSESMKKGYGFYNNKAFKAKQEESGNRKKRKKWG